MKKGNFRFAAAFIVISLFMMGCNEPAEKAEEAEVINSVAVAKPDMAKVKAEIQALENSWAEADNARDVNAVLAFYADDAVTMSDDMANVTGKAAIQKDIEASMAKKPKGATVAYDVVEVFGDENVVTEVGKYTTKDAGGKVTEAGRYMAVWEKRDGKYICIRDMNNSETKQ